MSFFGKNIRKIRKEKKLSQHNFANLFDLKRVTLGAYEEERSEPRLATLIKIANYFSISIDDLLTKDLTKTNLENNLTFPNLDNFTKIPCITTTKESDYCKFYKDSNFIEGLPKLQLPIFNTKKDTNPFNQDVIFSNLDNPEKKLRGYIISNLDMFHNNTGYKPQDVVIGEWVKKELFHKIENGSLVIIILEETILFRKFHFSSNKIILKASNKTAADLYIEPAEINEIWQVKYNFFKRIPENKNIEIEKKLNFLEEEFMKLRENLE